MEKQNKLDIPPNEIVALASSLAICISQKYSSCDIDTIRHFVSALCTNLSLIEHQKKSCNSSKKPC